MTSRAAQITMKRKKIRLNLLKSMAGTWKKMKKLYCSPVMRRRLEEPRVEPKNFVGHLEFVEECFAPLACNAQNLQHNEKNIWANLKLPIQRK